MRAGSPPEACHVLPIDGLRDPAIRFFTLREDGDSARLRRAQAARRRVMARSSRCAPPTRRSGRGVGKAMLDHLISGRAGEGMTRLSLETGSTEQFAAANRLYEKEGFERTAARSATMPTRPSPASTPGKSRPARPARRSSRGWRCGRRYGRPPGSASRRRIDCVGLARLGQRGVAHHSRPRRTPAATGCGRSSAGGISSS